MLLITVPVSFPVFMEQARQRNDTLHIIVPCTPNERRSNPDTCRYLTRLQVKEVLDDLRNSCTFQFNNDLRDPNVTVYVYPTENESVKAIITTVERLIPKARINSIRAHNMAPKDESAAEEQVEVAGPKNPIIPPQNISQWNGSM